jgi:hypothetical protein
VPKIREYTTQSEVAGAVGGRRATAEDFGFAKGIEALGEGVEKLGDGVYKAAENSELSSLHATFSEKEFEYRKYIKEAHQDGTLDMEEFLEDYNTTMEGIREGISTKAGQDFFTRQMAEQRKALALSAFDYQADLAGQKARQDQEVAINNLSGALVVDPTDLEGTISRYASGVENLTEQGLPRAEVDKILMAGKTQLTTAAVKGWIDLNVDYAEQQLKQGKFDNYLNGEQKAALLGDVAAKRRAVEVEAERRKKLQQEEREAQQKKTQNEFLAKAVQGKLSADEILKSNLEAFGSGSKNQFIDMLEAQSKQALKTDPGTFRELYKRIHLPDGDPDKLLDENELNEYLIAGKLNMESLNDLREEIHGSHTEEGKALAAAKKQVFDQADAALVQANPLAGIKDPIGEQQMLKFRALVRQKEKELIKQGKSPHVLFDPSSQEYVGKHISQFARNPFEALTDSIESMTRGMDDGKPKSPEEEAAKKRLKELRKKYGKE